MLCIYIYIYTYDKCGAWDIKTLFRKKVISNFCKDFHLE